MTSTDTSAPVREVANGLDKAADTIDQTEHRLSARLSEAANALEARYRELTVEVEKLVGKARDEGTKRYGELQERVREQPEIGIGLGVLAGMAIAMILSGSHRTIVVRDRHL